MNAYNNQMRGYGGGECPYRYTCPVKRDCPFCPHQMEGNTMINPGHYGNAGIEMQYYINNAQYPVMHFYSNEPPAEMYGYDNIYPDNMHYSSNISSNQYHAINPQYNQYGYINPEENMHSPWENNRMYGMNNISPLTIPNCPCR
jgi:hypothetical protein